MYRNPPRSAAASTAIRSSWSGRPTRLRGRWTTYRAATLWSNGSASNRSIRSSTSALVRATAGRWLCSWRQYATRVGSAAWSIGWRANAWSAAEDELGVRGLVLPHPQRGFHFHVRGDLRDVPVVDVAELPQPAQREVGQPVTVATDQFVFATALIGA